LAYIENLTGEPRLTGLTRPPGHPGHPGYPGSGEEIQGGYPGGLAETDSRWPNEV